VTIACKSWSKRPLLVLDLEAAIFIHPHSALSFMRKCIDSGRAHFYQNILANIEKRL
jgi:hypothetical protein